MDDPVVVEPDIGVRAWMACDAFDDAPTILGPVYKQGRTFPRRTHKGPARKLPPFPVKPP